MKFAKGRFVGDGPGKPVGISRFIGRRPIFAFGNSNGDLQIQQWTVAANSVRFAGILHNDDLRAIGNPQLENKAWEEAKQRGWTVVDVKQDWPRTAFLRWRQEHANRAAGHTPSPRHGR